MTSVEVLQVGTLDGNYDFSGVTSFSKLVVDNVRLLDSETITVANGVEVSLATAAGLGTVDDVIVAYGAVNAAPVLTLNGYQGATGASVEELTVTGAKAATLTINSITANNAISTFTAPAETTKLVITGDKNLTVGATTGAKIATIDAGAATGNVTMTVDGTAANLTFTGGAGNDKVVFGTTNTFTTADTVDGGAGTNTLGMAAAQAVNTTKAFTNIKNFQTLEITTATADTNTINVDHFGVQNVSFAAAATATTTVSNLVSGAKLSFADTSGVVATLKADGAADVLNVAVSGASKTLTLNSTNFETLNVDVSGASTAATVAITDPQLKTLTLTGLKTSGADAGTYADAKVTFSTTLGTVVSTVDLSAHQAATAANGAVVTLNNAAVNGATVTGSSKNDVITGSGRGDVIDGGAGADIIYGDNGGTKQVQIATVGGTIQTASTFSLTVAGQTVSFTTDATTAESATAIATALKNAINSDAELTGLVTASNSSGVVTITSLVDGAVGVSSTVTHASSVTGTLALGTIGTTSGTTAGTVGNTAADIINGGAGADIIIGNGGADILTGGAGSDTFVFYAASQSTGSSAANWTTITDFRSVAGEDKIHISAVTNGTEVVDTTTIQTASSLAQGLIDAFAGTGAGTNSVIKAFKFGGDTYIAVDNNNSATIQSTDMVIKISGESLTALTADMFIL